MTKYYLASRFSQHPEMRRIRDLLIARGHQVTSRWIDRGAAGDEAEDRINRQLDAHPELSEPFAREDVEDILAAEELVFVVPPSGGGRGGRHVEFGIAYGLRRPISVIGPRENVFHCLSSIAWFPDVATWIVTLDHP